MRYVAFLRAINVGGRRVTNTELLQPFVDLGLHDVRAFQAAGNIVFDADRTTTADTLSQALREHFDFEVPVFLRSADELARLLADAPTLAGDGKLQIGFLHAEPPPVTVTAVSELVPVDDQVEILGRELWWRPREGISTSALDVRQIETLVGGMTIRTAGTVERIAAKFF